MTSPPGAKSVARPWRAASGPANRIEARTRRHRSAVQRGLRQAAARRARRYARRATRHAQIVQQPSMVSTSWMSGTFAGRRGSSVSTQAASMGSTAFLLPGGRNVRRFVAAPDDEPRHGRSPRHSTVTLFARCRGLSMSAPRALAL